MFDNFNIESKILSVGDLGLSDQQVNVSGVKGDFREVNFNTLIRFKETPSIWSYDVGGDIVDMNVIASLLAANEAQTNKDDLMNFTPAISSIYSQLQDETLVAKILASVFYDRNGTVKPGHLTFTFEMMRAKIHEAMPSMSLASSYLFAILINPIRIVLKLNVPSKKVTTFEKRLSVYPTKSDFKSTLALEQYISVIKDLDYSFLDDFKDKRAINTGALASGLSNAVNKLRFKIHQIERLDTALSTVMILIKSKLTKNYAPYEPMARSIFDDVRLDTMAGIINLAEFSLTELPVVPLIGQSFWMQSIELVSSLLHSSNRLEIVDLNVVKDFYRLDHVYDSKPFKKGCIISKNVKDISSLELYKMRDTTVATSVLTRDKQVENVLSTIYEQAKRVSSTEIHDYALKSLESTVNTRSPLFMVSIGIDAQELSILSYLFSKRTFLLDNLDTKMGADVIVTDEGEIESKWKFLYEFDTDNSLIKDNLSTFLGRGLTTNPHILMMYATPFVGKSFFQVDTSKFFKEHLSTMYFKDSLMDILNGSLTSTKEFRLLGLTPDSSAIKVKLSTPELIHFYGVDQLVFRKPDVGKHMFSGLLAMREVIKALSVSMVLTREDVRNYVTEVLSDKVLNPKSYTISQANFKKLSAHPQFQEKLGVLLTRSDEALDLGLLGHLRPIISDNESVSGLTSNLIAKIWVTNPVFAGADISDSILTRDEVKAELATRVGLFLLTQLGFIEDHKDYSELLKRFSEWRIYSVMGMK